MSFEPPGDSFLTRMRRLSAIEAHLAAEQGLVSHAAQPRRSVPAGAAHSPSASLLPIRRAAVPVAFATSGIRPPAATPDEEEWRRRRKGTGGGGAAPARAPAAAGPKDTPKKVSTASSGNKLAIASGSQSAVVKLASYASGRARMSALMTYQSRGGTLELEREDGSMVHGKDAVRALANRWGEESADRESSKDTLAITLTVQDEEFSNERIREYLTTALNGHRYAWRSEGAEGADRAERGQTIHIVLVAAGSERDEMGKRATRYYPKEKSLDLLQNRIESTFGVEGRMEVLGWGHGVQGAAKQLCRLSCDGTKPAETSDGKLVDSHEVNLSVAESWKRDLRSKERRDVAHIILSAKPGTDREAFVHAARATLALEFAEHEYAFTLHTDRGHLHIHAAVRMENHQRERIHPNVAMFHHWRETLAEQARARGIEMVEARRFDRARPPAYQLKHVRMVERGTAPESVRRRIDAVKKNAIHIPTRDEGRARALEAASQWANLVATKPFAQAPQLADGALRLYRAERPRSATSREPIFTSDRNAAETMAKITGGKLFYVDVDAARLASVKRANINPERNFVVDRELALRAKTLDRIDSTVLQFQQRSQMAVVRGNTRHATQPREQGESAVATVQEMTASRDALQKHLATASMLLPSDTPAEEKQLFEIDVKRVLDQVDAHIAAQRRVETEGPPSAGGDAFVKPKAKEHTGFVHEQKGEEIHYFHTRDNQREGLAFVDTGKRVEVRDWKNDEALSAALKLAADKWDSVSVNGSARYLDRVVELAAEHRIKISNPELQDRIRAATEARWERSHRREVAPGIMEQGAPVERARPEHAATEASASVYEGNLVRHGRDHYEHDSRNKMNYFVVLKKEGREQTIWGAKLEEALAKAEIRDGDYMRLARVASEPVTVETRKVDPKTGEEHHASRDVQRHVWTVQKTRPEQHERKLSPEDEMKLAALRREMGREAQRETTEALVASTTHAEPVDGTRAHRFHTEEQGATARTEARQMLDEVEKPVEARPGESREVEQLRHRQNDILARAKAAQDAKAARQGEERER